MARKLIQYIEITDDFDRESPADETVEIAIDGMVYELDLQDPRAKEVREFLHPFMEVAHDKWRMPPRPGKKRKAVTAQALTETPKPMADGGVKTSALMRDRAARNEIREWANANGHELAKTGKIPVEVLRGFREANPDAYIPETTLIDAGLSDVG